jgi:hypothetical protein
LLNHRRLEPDDLVVGQRGDEQLLPLTKQVGQRLVLAAHVSIGGGPCQFWKRPCVRACAVVLRRSLGMSRSTCTARIRANA